MLIMMGCIRLPEFMMQAIRSAGSCTTAVTMLLMGMMLAETDSFKGFFTRDLWLYSFIRLIFIPAVVTAGLSLFTLDASVRGISVILSGMPAGSTTAILAARYGGDYMFATRCIVVTTVLSLLTVPFWFFVVS